MARSLYRFYLYIVFIVLVIFAVGVTTQLLNTLLLLTPLRGPYSSAPDQASIVQSLVLAIVGWIISGGLGGLHYWLIRRDIQHDPAAGMSAIRSFFLNITEALGMLLAVPLIGFGVIGNWAYNNGTSTVGETALALPTLVMVILLELERRRTSPQKGAALAFQRLHFFGVQLILLFYTAGAFLTGLRPLVDGVFFGGRGTTEICANLYSYCPSYNLVGLTFYLLWFVACWLVYSLITRSDSSLNTRIIMHGLSLAIGIGYILGSVFVALELILAPLFKISVALHDVLGYSAQYDFVSPLLLGVFVTAIYHLLLRDISRRGLLDLQVRHLAEWAIAGVLLGIVFWWGVGYGLYNLLQALAPAPNNPDGHAWTMTIALLITGVSYIPLDFYLLRRFAHDPVIAIGPRRGFVLALLAGGTLSLAIGGVAALYTSVTALLGSPITNWQQTAHIGLAGVIVGVVVVGIYLWATRREHLLSGHPRPDQPPTAPAPTIENIIDDLLAGRITRDEAIKRLHALSSTPALELI
jgi:hypothetical protein